ncbi:MAG: M23 family metallopeptidase [Alphaproteobacteria bacterium]|nr:M23 family metallopeptidase [Alphaproteobacteria bacterium]
MRNVSVKPIMISPVPAIAGSLPVIRPVARKRLSRLRLNWFVVGAFFGIGLSFFMSFLLVAVVTPAYDSVVARLQPVKINETAGNSSGVPLPLRGEGALNPSAQLSTPLTPPSPAGREGVTAPTATAALTYPRTLALKVGKGDTLLDLLLANRVQTGEAHAVINALRSKFNPRNLRIGQKISVTLERHEKLGDAAAVRELAIRLPNLSTIELQRLQDGGFNVAATEDVATSRTFRGFGKVRTSLLQAGADGHIPAAAMQELLKAYSYDIDFQREIHPGDSIEVLMERKPAKSGSGFVGYAGIRYAALTLRGKKHEIFRFKDSFGDAAWFDGKGRSIKKSLLRTPVDAVHITSGFGLRTHPIMGYTKMHRGVDFGAPTGTPIMAAGDGVVTFKGWKSGYGNFVTLKHNEKYETAYGHISRFSAIKVGSRVKQGQVIAYVGMTGMATGPHLHYEVHEAGNQVNPVAKQFNMAAGLSGKSLAAFKTAKQSALNELATLARGTATVASAR